MASIHTLATDSVRNLKPRTLSLCAAVYVIQKGRDGVTPTRKEFCDLIALTDSSGRPKQEFGAVHL